MSAHEEAQVGILGGNATSSSATVRPRRCSSCGFVVFHIGQAEGEDAIADHLGEVNGLVLFWGGWNSTFGGDDDGVDPSEVQIRYLGNPVQIALANGGVAAFVRACNGGTGLWESSIDVLKLWDYGDGDAGNSPTPPPQFERDLRSATFDANTGQFTAFTLAVDG